MIRSEIDNLLTTLSMFIYNLFPFMGIIANFTVWQWVPMLSSVVKIHIYDACTLMDSLSRRGVFSVLYNYSWKFNSVKKQQSEKLYMFYSHYVRKMLPRILIRSVDHYYVFLYYWWMLYKEALGSSCQPFLVNIGCNGSSIQSSRWNGWFERPNSYMYSLLVQHSTIVKKEKKL